MNYKYIHLGAYKTKEEAEEAYDKACDKYNSERGKESVKNCEVE